MKNEKRSPSTQILHYPRLDTVFMIEDFIRAHSGEFTKTNLWKKLPKKTMYQTFCVIFDYLSSSSKISTDSQGKIGWIYNPELAKKFLAKGVVVR